MLLCGEEVDDDIYDFKSASIREITCDIQSYKDLIQLCFSSEEITATFVAAFVRSITLYDLMKVPVSRVPIKNLAQVHENVKLNADDIYGCELDEIILEELLNKDQDWGIAPLATIPTDELKIKISLISRKEKKKKMTETVLQSLRDDLQNSFFFSSENCAVMESLDPNDEQVVNFYLECLASQEDFIRIEGAFSFQKVKNRPDLVPILMKAYDTETHSPVMRGIAGALIELGNQDEIIAFFRERFPKEKEKNYPCLSYFAQILARSNHEEEKRHLAKVIVHMIEEKLDPQSIVQYIIALRILNISDMEEVITLLDKLLEYDFPDVIMEAGTTLVHLKPEENAKVFSVIGLLMFHDLSSVRTRASKMISLLNLKESGQPE